MAEAWGFRSVRGRGPSRRRRRLIALVVVLAVIAAVAVTFRKPMFQHNFGVVDGGKVYRSAQPEGELASRIEARRLKSILNLRGGSPQDPFYAAEVRITEERGVAFYDFPMNAERRPTRAELLTLLDFFERCDYPLLIHCRQGADRTGLASALYLMSQKNVGPQEAEAALTLAHGHFNLGNTAHLHEPIVEYAEWLKRSRQAHSPDVFRDWLRNDYRSEGGIAKYRPLRPGPRKALAGRDRATKGELIVE